MTACLSAHGLEKLAPGMQSSSCTSSAAGRTPTVLYVGKATQMENAENVLHTENTNMHSTSSSDVESDTNQQALKLLTQCMETPTQFPYTDCQ
jgi:hypothetical protein